MKAGFQGINNGNGKLTLTADNLKFACAELGISDDKHTLRRAARGFDLYYSGKVEHVNDHTFKVASQYDRQRPYQVTLHEGATKTYGYCTCPDWMNYSGDMDVPDVNFWCKHMISAALWLHSNANGNGSKITNDCGSKRAKAIQAKLNGQDNGNGAQKAPSQATQLDITDPFQECELKDIAQVEGRSNGELVHKLSNGEYVISYNGIMTLSEKHHITFETAIHSETSTVIAQGRCGTSERVSGKPINGSMDTAMELAKRNAARQLLPLGEIKALEHKTKLESEFDWQKAQAKCVELVTDFNLDIIIHELVQDNKLRMDSLSGYSRTEWLVIHKACQEDATNNDGGDNSPPSPTLDPKSVNNWSYNSPEVREQCKQAIAEVRERKAKRKVDNVSYRRKRMTKQHDEKPLEFEVDTTKPNWVTLRFSNGKSATVYDQTIYESVLRA